MVTIVKLEFLLLPLWTVSHQLIASVVVRLYGVRLVFDRATATAPTAAPIAATATAPTAPIAATANLLLPLLLALVVLALALALLLVVLVLAPVLVDPPELAVAARTRMP